MCQDCDLGLTHRKLIISRRTLPATMKRDKIPIIFPMDISMQLLETIFQQYLSASLENITGKSIRRTVATPTSTAVDIAIRDLLPAFFQKAIAASGRDPTHYRVYGSTGQINFPYAKVPWVAILDRKITTSTERGYYIVLLFREDLQGCVLSLNQGYTEFEESYGLARLAAAKIRESAARAARYVDLPSDFTEGVPDLAATGDLGRGYENGSIISKAYSRVAPPSESELTEDIMRLLDIYDTLQKRAGINLTELIAEASEDNFQEAAAILSKKDNYRAPPPGPVARPAKVPNSGSRGYRRNPNVAGRSMKQSGYACEIDGNHQTFICKATNNNFVEAHHLVPMGEQDHFKFSLDIVENIVALCPLCHRKLHHGRFSEKIILLEQLYKKREAGLKARGVALNEIELNQLYKNNTEN